MSDSDLYRDDIRLWFEIQNALLRGLAAGEAVADQVDWPHIAEEIEDLGRADAQCPEDQQEITRLTALLAAAEARVDDLTRELADTQAELAAVRDQAEASTPR
jgi:hypothetical protein